MNLLVNTIVSIDRSDPEMLWRKYNIARRLGMSYEWVTLYLPDKYKNPVKAEAGRIGGRRSRPPASRLKAEKLPQAQPVPGFHIKKDADDTDRFLDDLENLYFLRPGDELTSALDNWCRTRKVHWSVVVTEALKLFFATQGEDLRRDARKK